MGLGFWILGAVIVIFVIISWVIAKAILKFLNRERPVDLDTPLYACANSYAADKALASSFLQEKESISSLYERKCIKEPVRYEHDPDMPRIVDTYKDLLQGRILDPEAQHAPSERLEGKVNNDYLTYLRNQRRCLKKSGIDNSWFQQEIKRINRVLEEDNIRGQFFAELLGLGIPADFIPFLVQDDKIEEYTPEEWRRIAESLKLYLKDFKDDVVMEFFYRFSNVEILTDYDKMEAYAQLSDINMSKEIIWDYMEGAIEESDVMDIIRLHEYEEYSWKEAKDKVITQNYNKTKSEALRSKYRKVVG